jgi:hypothetical protein
MLASTVQFSNNDQPPITPLRSASSLGPASRRASSRSHPQIPNSAPGTTHRLSRSTPKQY